MELFKTRKYHTLFFIDFILYIVYVIKMEDCLFIKRIN